jgi:WD40 repeat protein
MLLNSGFGLIVLSVLLALLTNRRILQLFHRALDFLRCPKQGLAFLEEQRALRFGANKSTSNSSQTSTTIVVSSLSGNTWKIPIGAHCTGLELKANVAERAGIAEAEVLLVPPGAGVPLADEDGIPLKGGDDECGLQVPWSFVRVPQRLALSGAKDGTMKLWDIDRGTCVETFRGHGGVIFTVSADWRHRFALSGAEDGMPKLWDLNNGDCQDRFAVREACKEKPIFCICADWTHRRAVSGSFGMLTVWDLDGGPAREFCGGCSYICCVAADWATRRAVSGSEDKSLRLWDLDSGDSEALPGHTGTIFSVSVDWGSNTALSASSDRTLRLWDLERRVCSRVLEGHTGGVCAVTADWEAMRAVSGSFDLSLRIWDLVSGLCLGNLLGHNDAVWCVTLDWSQRRVLSGSYDRTIRVWDLEESECTAVLEGHKGRVHSLSASWMTR